MGEISVKVEGMAGGTHVADGPLTTVNIREASADLLRNDFGGRIPPRRHQSPDSPGLDRAQNHRRHSRQRTAGV